MTQNGKGTLTKIAVAVVCSIIVGLISMVIASQNRITAVEVKVQSIETSLRDNRVENREEHRAIVEKLDAIAKDVRK